ncbi:MAG: tetratricopeptide repeat protein [Candidatus Hermodarchaeota archaeon]
MSSHSIFTEFNGTISDLFKTNEKYTFLVGAGISMDAPTNMPSAKQIVWSLLNLFAPEEEIEELFSLDLLRYELVIEKIQDIFDAELKFMDYLELVNEPNLIHLFLALSIIRGHYVVTTNFDYLIEQGLLKILNSDFHKDIIPVITKEDFLLYKEPYDLIKNGKFPIYKIHGSKRNIISDSNTQDSLITTISALGREREEGVTFAIEPFKKPAMSALMFNRTLVVMGYSGSDDFDIGPTLKELPSLNRLIWIEHSNEDSPKIESVRKTKKLKKINFESQIGKVLAEIRSSNQFEVIRIKVNTKTFLNDFIWDLILPNEEIEDVIRNIKDSKISSFGEWVKDIYTTIQEIEKFRFSCRLYYDLKQIDSLRRVANLGLEISEKENNLSSKSRFLNYLGLFNQIKGEYDKALDYYKVAYDIDKELGDKSGISADVSNIGSVLMTLGHYDMALDNFKDSLQMSKDLKQDFGQITALNNIGRIHEQRKDYQKSLDAYNEAIKISEQVGALEQKAALLNNIGRVFSQQEDYEKSYSYYEEALHVIEELGDLYGKVILLNNIGRIFSEQNQLEKALIFYNDAIDVAARLGDKAKIAGCLNNVGSIFLAQGKLDLALKQYEEALEIETSLGDPLMKIIYLNNIGMIHTSKKNYAIATKYYEDALEISEEIGDQHKSALLHTKIGSILASTKKLEESLERYEKALEIYNNLNDLSNKAATMSNIARIYFSIENYEKAWDLFEETLHIDEEIGDRMNVASDLMNLAKICKIRGDYDKALVNYERSLEIFSFLKYEEGVNFIRNEIKEIKKKIA